MKFYIVENGYIVATGENDSSEPDMPRADEVVLMLSHPPVATEGHYPALREDLTWDFLPIPQEPEDEEISAEEFLAGLEALL